MFKPHTVLTFGLWLIIINFLGIPSTWKERLVLLTGLLLVLIYLKHLSREVIVKLAHRQHQADTFTENRDRAAGGPGELQ